jgi:hypothetical protein
MSRARIVNRLPQFLAGVEHRAAGAITQALILGASEASAMTPRATSTLINSQFKLVEKIGDRIVGTVGYTAEYALAVHEAPGKLQGLNLPRPDGKGVYWGPSGEPEFLRKGFERAKPAIRSMLKRALKPGPGP